MKHTDTRLADLANLGVKPKNIKKIAPKASNNGTPTEQPSINFG